MKTFIKNLKLAGGEILSEIPKDWYQTKAEFGVAENGSVFIKDYKLMLRTKKEKKW